MGVRAMAAKTDEVQQELLAKELRGLIPKLDTEGLAFLVEQARVHLYNMQVEELNKAADAANAAAEMTKTFSGKQQAKRNAKGDNLKIDGTESGSSYYLHYRNDSVMFSRGEMVRLVKIAHGNGQDMEIRERLYNWFDRERRDVFAVLPLAGKYDDLLKALAALLKNNFKLQ